jgi:hypothetical protein
MLGALLLLHQRSWPLFAFCVAFPLTGGSSTQVASSASARCVWFLARLAFGLLTQLLRGAYPMSDSASSEPGREGRDPSSALEMVGDVAPPTRDVDDDFPQSSRWIPRACAASSLVAPRRGFVIEAVFLFI